MASFLKDHMKTISCIGVGTVGAAWAVTFARAGYKVTLYDSFNDAIKRTAIPKIKETLELLGEHGFLNDSIDAVMGRLHVVGSVEEAVSDAIYVQESVREDLQIKQELFAQIAALTPRETLLASSTSALKGSAFLNDIRYPERAIVAHPVNPPSLIPLVELCATPWTSPDTLEKAKSFLSDIGMEPVTLHKEIDGFILNRLQFTLVAEAMHLVGEGYCSAEDIDKVMTRGLALRWASIGPFQTMHLNAAKGFKGFVEQLEPMMKRLGRDAKTEYDWDSQLSDAIHESLEADISVAQVPQRQKWRNNRILKTRKLQDGP